MLIHFQLSRLPHNPHRTLYGTFLKLGFHIRSDAHQDHLLANHQAVLIWTFQLLDREPVLNELAEIKKYFLLIFPDSVYQLA
ncbi:hypothetical protein B4R78_07540 [Acinetobacter nosocomialis]|uniref:Uncharacterized protein n=1 Tax=Acinetobacter baumannii TaxID=470 RepID=A0A241ZES0_ACIBA|nr:hypothetical protein B9X83_03640 [Acinetobacter nosocomialis]OTM13779.1 hypothetical protein B9X54_10310 [Acinetobacter baumannii]OTM88557.1 hypothetical protein B9X95_08635 [Acinetobacter baumannii]OUR08207.1 hypothetical protein B4R78_07540 [Acinetobacter nosocomialis]